MIAHASQDEVKKTVGATPGDNTTKEVCIRSFYKGPWNYMIRCTDPEMRERIACAMEAAAKNDLIGYSQPRRNSLLNTCRNLNYNPGAVKVLTDCDCSSLVTVACIYAGIPEKDLYKSNNCCTTGNIRSRLTATGKFNAYTDKKYLDSDQYLHRGDILLREPGHVAVNITEGSKANETQTTTLKAVDISQYNIIGDYKAMAQQVKNVFIRVGYRSSSSGKIVEDTSFKKHIENCLANNMNVGVYFYDQSINENESNEQADWVLDKIKPYNVTLPIYIDSEAMRQHDGRADNISKDQRTKNVIAFCNRVQSKGKVSGIYASDSWFKSMLNFDQIKNYSIWCARYSVNKPTISKYDIWQYGSEMYTWATGAIDTNYIYTDLKISGGNNSKPTVTPTPTPSVGVTTEKAILLMGQVNIKEGTLNVRKLPTTDSQVVLQLKKDQYVQLRGDLGDWYRMDMGYVSKKYIKEVHGIVTGDNLRVRSTPDSSLTTNVVTTLPINTEVIVCTAGNGWYYVLLDNGTTGWVSGQYLKLK